MLLREIANQAIQPVNPDIQVEVLVSAGYAVGAGMKQTPSYAAPVAGPAQLQALDADDLKQLDGLNVQGTVKAIYLKGVLAGVVRPDQKGGDIVRIDGRTWLVVKVLEGWANWTKAAIVLQGA